MEPSLRETCKNEIVQGKLVYHCYSTNLQKQKCLVTKRVNIKLEMSLKEIFVSFLPKNTSKFRI